ncbi:MAG TPA: hypothetical protein DGP39_02390 [Verrucomicrobiales bacterium]|nr:hypothetical protein [Verrucomicrobiales bacterium]
MREKGGQATKPQPKGNLFFAKMSQNPAISAVILNGGRARRMGTDKAVMRLGRRTLLGHARAVAAELALPCTVLTADDRPGLGPLGGIETALRLAQGNRVLFLSCDMPFLQPVLVAQLLAVEAPAVFVSAKGRVGFPFCLSPALLPKVSAQLDAGERSLQALARRLRARRLRVRKIDWPQLENLNTPADVAAARARLQSG